MKDVVIDLARLAFTPVLQDKDLSQVYLFLCAQVGRNETCLIEMPIEKLASSLNTGMKQAKAAIDWLVSLGLVTRIGEDAYDVNSVAIECDDWVEDAAEIAAREFEEALVNG